MAAREHSIAIQQGALAESGTAGGDMAAPAPLLRMWIRRLPAR